ncbi:hypothetical protein HHI36_000952 [Cryptolaemus montrouzieri]|uniref:Uncharacterized protein n=1 Tax=Cryptolaemus montrouzieri TaxID=559131 RepID=A0ABD2P7G6_9CUCU
MDTNYNTLLSKLESLERENRALKNELKVVNYEVVVLKHNKQGLNFSEINDMLYRSNNVIIYNLTLSSAKLTRGDIPKVVVVGKKGPKNRPTKVILTCRDTVMKVLKNSFNIKNAFKDRKISISDDRTDLERTFLNETRDQLHERLQAGEKNWIIKHTKGVPAIVKLFQKLVSSPCNQPVNALPSDLMAY